MAVLGFNTLTEQDRALLAFARIVVRENAITSTLVDTSYEQQFAEQGDTINIIKPNRPSVQTINPGLGNENTPTALVPTKVALQLTEWKEVLITVSDFEMKKMMNGFMSRQLEESVLPLVEAINAWILQQMAINSYWHVGTALSLPTDPALLRQASTILKKNNISMMGKSAMLDPDVTGKFEDSDRLRKVNESGSSDVLRRAVVGELSGFMVYDSNQVYDHTAGTLAVTVGTLETEASVTAGVTSLLLAATAVTGTLVAGDLFTIAGDNQHYRVTALATAAANAITVSIEPALQVTIAGAKEVTVIAGGRRDLCFQQSAFAFASPMLRVDNPCGNEIGIITDPVSKISLKLERSRHNHANRVSLSALWGGKMVYPDASVIMLDAAN